MRLFQCIDRDEELQKQLVHYVPKGYIYVEPFANGMSLFWYLANPFPVEVINDLYGDIVGIYRVLQDIENYEIIIDKLAKTPFSEEEFNKAVRIIKDPNVDVVNKTWAFFVIHSEYLIKIKKHNSGFEKFLNNMSKHDRTWCCPECGETHDRDVNASINLYHVGLGRPEVTPVERALVDDRSPNDYLKSHHAMKQEAQLHKVEQSAELPLRLKIFVYWRDRLSRAQIDCVDVVKCIKYWDTSDTVFYIDPPCDLDTELYKSLVDALLSVKGKVLLFGYEQPAYKNLVDAGWQKLHNNELLSNYVLYLNFKKNNILENAEKIKEKQKKELFEF